jgi:hypothetical protein
VAVAAVDVDGTVEDDMLTIRPNPAARMCG